MIVSICFKKTIQPYTILLWFSTIASFASLTIIRKIIRICKTQGSWFTLRTFTSLLTLTPIAATLPLALTGDDGGGGVCMYSWLQKFCRLTCLTETRYIQRLENVECRKCVYSHQQIALKSPLPIYLQLRISTNLTVSVEIYSTRHRNQAYSSLWKSMV